MATKLTADDYVTLVRRACGNPPTDEIENSVILQLVNLVYRRVCAKYNHPELDDSSTVNTTASQAYVTSPILIKNCIAITGIYNSTNGCVLKNVTSDMLDWVDRGQGATGAPYYYAIEENASSTYHKIALWPMPDAVYSLTVAYKLAPDDLVQSPSATSTVIGVVWDEVIMAGAIAEVAALLGDYQRAQYWEGKAATLARTVYPGTITGGEVPFRVLPVRS